LRLANEIRSARAKLKKDLASGKIELAQILAQPPECVRTARVRDVIVALPRIGSVKAGRILADCGIAHSKTLGRPDRAAADRTAEPLPPRQERQVIRRGCCLRVGAVQGMVRGPQWRGFARDVSVTHSSGSGATGSPRTGTQIG
jgi:hypothetical protein